MNYFSHIYQTFHPYGLVSSEYGSSRRTYDMIRADILDYFNRKSLIPKTISRHVLISAFYININCVIYHFFISYDCFLQKICIRLIIDKTFQSYIYSYSYPYHFCKKVDKMDILSCLSHLLLQLKDFFIKHYDLP